MFTPFPFFLLWLALIISAAILFLRPHEDVFGGEDPGSYLNSSLTYQRANAFFYTDELLAETPLSSRSLFLYGHSWFGATKDACLWVKDLATARMGPRFQPAYPLVMGAITHFLPNQSVLFVAPLFALLVSLALLCLASISFPGTRLPAFAAAALYLFNPLTLWHGRCPRPELLASFFIFAGAALLINAWNKKKWRGSHDIALGAMCIAVSPFFHIMAFSILLPTAIIISIIILRGRDDFFICPVIAVIASVFYIFQTAYVTDFYRAGRLVLLPVQHPFIAGIILFTAMTGLVAGCSISHLRPQWIPSLPARLQFPAKWLRYLLAALGALIMLALTLMPGVNGSRVFIEHALYFTDYRTVIALISLPIALAGLAGWLCWILLPEGRPSERALLALVVLPNLVWAGNLTDFMTTRYLMIALVPALALSLAMLTLPLRRIDLRLWDHPAFAMITVFAILTIGLNQRTHLVTVTEYKGLLSFLEPFAQRIQKEHGALLCEYSRLSAPFEHFFGIPTLGLDPQRKDNYEKAESAWESIIWNHPERPAYFLTPFQAPISDRLCFQKIDQGVFHGSKMQPTLHGLPKKANAFELPLTLYRTFAKRAPAAPETMPIPFTYKLGDGNMGLRHFAFRPSRTAVITGLRMSPYDKIQLPVPDLPANETIRQLFVMCRTTEPVTLPLEIHYSPAIRNYRERWLQLPDGFNVLQITGSDIPACTNLIVSAKSNMLFLDAIFLTDSGTIHTAQKFPTTALFSESVPEIIPRWTRANSQILLPATGARDTFVLLFAQAPPGPESAVNVCLSSPDLTTLADWQVPANAWRWLIAPIPYPTLMHDTWASLETRPTYDPRAARYPSDLGILLSYVIVLSAP